MLNVLKNLNNRSPDQSSNIPFLRYKFSNIFEELFTMRLFAEITDINDFPLLKGRKKLKTRDCDILKIESCKILTPSLLKLEWGPFRQY